MGMMKSTRNRRTMDLVDYVYVKYGNNWKESDEISDEMLVDLYNYDMLKGKYLSVIESSKATDKDYTKLLVTDEMLDATRNANAIVVSHVPPPFLVLAYIYPTTHVQPFSPLLLPIMRRLMLPHLTCIDPLDQ
ncbi:hypothetical protein Tco_0309336 [Tanacetum coccineum]